MGRASFHRMDKSFQALILSLAVHFLLALWAARMPSSQIEMAGRHPIEIDIREPALRMKKNFVMETEDPSKDLLRDLKDKANFLSKLTKRVKEETRARATDATQNRPGQDPSPSLEARAKGLMGHSAGRERGQALQLPPGVGPQHNQDQGGGPFGRQVVVGQSTVGEYIPGVKEGAFTALNTDRFTYYTFFARINDQVRNRWVRNLRELASTLSMQQMIALAEFERTTQVDIQLNAEGEFVRSVVLKSSGFKGLDQAATLAFQSAAPFINPPKEMVEEDGLIHLVYGFVVQWQPSHMALSQ